MTQTQINIVGLIILAAIFFYFQVYRPNKLRKNPADLEVTKFPAQQMKLADIVSRNFAEKYYVLNQVNFDDLFHSPSMSKNISFRKHMSDMKGDVVLVDKRTNLPTLVVQLSSKNDRKEEPYINGAGLGCLYFAHADNENAAVEEISEALKIIEDLQLKDNNLIPA